MAARRARMLNFPYLLPNFVSWIRTMLVFEISGYFCSLTEFVHCKSRVWAAKIYDDCSRKYTKFQYRILSMSRETLETHTEQK